VTIAWWAATTAVMAVTSGVANAERGATAFVTIDHCDWSALAARKSAFGPMVRLSWARYTPFISTTRRWISSNDPELCVRMRLTSSASTCCQSVRYKAHANW